MVISPMERQLTKGRRTRAVKSLPIVGWREWLTIPTLQVGRIKAKIDSGARTSSLHASDIQAVTDRGAPYISFTVHPEQHIRQPAIACVAAVFDQRLVTSSSGHRELRYIIQVEVSLGGATWPVELSLTDRDSMGFRMLLGREALRRRVLIDTSRSFIAGRSHADISTVSTRKNRTKI